jgi:hypothetical protein
MLCVTSAHDSNHSHQSGELYLHDFQYVTSLMLSSLRSAPPIAAAICCTAHSVQQPNGTQLLARHSLYSARSLLEIITVQSLCFTVKKKE